MSDLRPHTEAEMREMFLENVRGIVQFWQRDAAAQSRDDAISGCAFSILVLLDGGHGLHPGCKVIPAPHPDDEAFNKSQNENWYPPDVDIGGALHEEFYGKKPTPPKAVPPLRINRR